MSPEETRSQFQPATLASLSLPGLRTRLYLWHEIRASWVWYDQPTKDAIAAQGWTPPRPSRQKPPIFGPGGYSPILDNDSGEDFLYLTRNLIDTTVGVPPPFKTLPRQDDPPAVPPEWLSGDTALDGVFQPYAKSHGKNPMYETEALVSNDSWLKSVSLRQLGVTLEFELSNLMHIRWSALGEKGFRPTDPNHPADKIDSKYNASDYASLADPYSSHVHPVFWQFRSWMNERVKQWEGVNGKANWKGRWLGGPSDVRMYDALKIVLKSNVRSNYWDPKK